MKTSIDFNEHLDAQARAYEIGKAEGIEQETAPRPCCGSFESCSTPCVPRAEHFREQRDQLVDEFNRTGFRTRPDALDYGVNAEDVLRISSLCKRIRIGQTS